MNLMGNAVKFTATGSVVLLVELVEYNGDYCRVRFTIRDTGIGIPAELQRKVFDPFFQVETGPVHKYGGTGLGTSIALAHVRRMGGELDLESVPGTGSTFRFALRLARTTPEPALPATEPRRIVRGKRILVADDNRTNPVLIGEIPESDKHPLTSVHPAPRAPA